MQDQERSDGIRGLRLTGKPVPTHMLGAAPEPEVPDTGEAAAVVAASAVSFVGGVSGQARQDVLDSTLLAQLAANAEFDRVAKPMEWYTRYTSVMEMVGWVLQNNGFTKRETGGGSLKLDAAAIDVLAAMLVPGQLTVLQNTLNALKSATEDSKVLTLFEGNAASGAGALFQLGVARRDNPDGPVALSIGTFHFTTSSHKNRFLFITWEGSEVGLEIATEAATLNERVYSVVREHVTAKLAARRPEFVANLTLAAPT